MRKDKVSQGVMWKGWRGEKRCVCATYGEDVGGAEDADDDAGSDY